MRLGVALFVGLVVATALPQAAAAQSGSLRSQLGAGTRIAQHSETAAVRFIGTPPGRPIARPTRMSADDSGRAVARAFLERYGDAFGIRDQDRELRVSSVQRPRGERSSVRLQQVHRGVPVLGGELVVNLDGAGNLLSVAGEALPEPKLSTAPAIEAGAARRTAIEAIAKHHEVPAEVLRATEPALWIYDSRLLGGPGLDRPLLVWRTEVTAEATSPIRELVLIDAQLGSVALHFNQIAHALDRRVCDAANRPNHLPCISPVRSEGGLPHPVVDDVNDAYEFSGDTYAFFAGLGRNSLDDAGMPLVSTVRYCASSCPFRNAFWNGRQMVHGTGFASADDVVGHELAHGVTEFTSHLFYYYQSGAINESLSDVFGELIDLSNQTGTDTPAVRWQMGEDIPGGAIRNMANPPAFGDPDRMTSPNYTADPNERDWGGVHVNSGVGNKAAFLITDGGTFNGRTVTALGIAKASRIYYEVAANLLTSASDYQDLFTALSQACANLVGTDAITAADCVEVQDAALATEMDQLPTNAPNPEAPICPTGQNPQNLFFDDLENAASGNWALMTAIGPNEWYYPQFPNRQDFDATYATSGTRNFWGYARAGFGDFSIAMTRSVSVPAGATYLRFRHAYGFDDSSGTMFDGGVLELSTNSGTTWQDAGSRFTHNGYDGPLSTGNPLGGRSAFGAESNGYISSRVDLSSLAGQSVRFRFRIGTDIVVDDFGWFIDDIQIYRCVTPAPPPDPSPDPSPDPLPSPDRSPSPDPLPSAGPTLANVSVDRCRRSGRGRRAGLRCRLVDHEAVERVTLRLKRGRKTVLRRTVRPRSSGVLTLKAGRKLRKGRYVVRLVLRDGDGNRRTLPARFRVR